MEAFGIMAFVFVMVALGRVRRLERILREHGIRPLTHGLDRQLRGHIGERVILSLYTGDGDVSGQVCRVLDADETWALLLLDQGKRAEKRVLIRLDDVKQIKSQEEKGERGSAGAD